MKLQTKSGPNSYRVRMFYVRDFLRGGLGGGYCANAPFAGEKNKTLATFFVVVIFVSHTVIFFTSSLQKTELLSISSLKHFIQFRNQA